VSRAVPDDKLLVVDKAAVLTAYGTVDVARSVDAFFTSDSAAVRVTFRQGHTSIAFTEPSPRLGSPGRSATSATRSWNQLWDCTSRS
jgi:hypothetical protein